MKREVRMTNPNLVWAPLFTPTYYLSGPMSGLPEYNYPHFHTVAAALRLLGHNVVNPAELNPTGGTREDCLRADIRALCDCTGLILLTGWQHSIGAHIELNLAHRLGLSIQTLDDFLKEHSHDPL
jgi:hypothetical protein